MALDIALADGVNAIGKDTSVTIEKMWIGPMWPVTSRIQKLSIDVISISTAQILPSSLCMASPFLLNMTYAPRGSAGITVRRWIVTAQSGVT